ncbi:FkbM family methyltransferase [Streptomyces sp. DSM 40750]|uniref:FkbM family methyltransferase n=1 Tax=Streptomyces sp. DSM 40750 TaxID=2801030 RepID=UPI00214B9388|nr:FkbM family methyltransferase [Streptomyces sp. DSM 40750]UUU24209.1 FkbM family methyltransferase [Streptomyces sp. DSM 40750]
MPLAIRLPHHSGVLEADGSYPRALNVLSRKQTAVQRQLRRSGLAGYEPVTQATLLALAQQAPPGSAVYDVGAHIGLYAALIDAVYGHRLSVHAFEPTPDTARICEDIRRHNGLGFELITSAVSDTPGTAELCLSLKGESSNSLNAAHRKHTETVSVPVTTLDAFTEERSARPHLIKIDVETLEGQVLAGALETVRRHRPWIVLEILPSSDHDALGRALDVLTELGYGLHLLQPESPWPGRNRGDYRRHVGGQCRDWLLAPAPLTYDFHHAVRTWLRAILACDERTNLIVPAGVFFPHGWNAPYRSALASEVHDRLSWRKSRPGRVQART